MKTIGEIIQNIRLITDNPVVRGGFAQVPNFILRDPELSLGAKVTYAMFLSYAWNNNSCFPGQERLAADMGMSRSRVTDFIGELETAGLVAIQRRGQGKTNIYTIHFQVRSRSKRGSRTGFQLSAGRRLGVDRSTSGSRPIDFTPYEE